MIIEIIIKMNMKYIENNKKNNFNMNLKHGLNF